MLQANVNVSERERKRPSGFRFWGAPFPVFMKVSFLLLVLGVLPSLILIFFILSSYGSIFGQYFGSATENLELQSAQQKLYLQIAVIFFVLLSALFIAALFFSRSLTDPVRRLIEGMNKLRRGEYETRLPLTSQDEIGLLAQEFNLMAERLKEVREREQAISRAKSQLIALTAHQFRTPLSAMKWSLSILHEIGKKHLTHEEKDLIEKTYQTNERMIKLISDMLDVIKIEEGRFGPLYQEHDLIEIAKESVGRFRDLARQKEIKLVFKPPTEPLPPLLCDRERITLVLNNLLDNAVNYTSAGGKVSFNIRQEKSGVKITVRDSGIGIPKNEMQQLFNRFFRGSNVLQLGIPGSGLGLWIVKNIIEAHNGKIKISSREGKGTTVSIVLPFQKQKILAQSEEPFRELIGE